MNCFPLISTSNQGRAMLLGYLAFSAVYLGSGTVDLITPRTLLPSWLDAAIPLIDWTVWIYLTQFLLLPAAIMLARDDRDRSQAFYAMLIATALAAVIFLAWPTQIERPAQPSSGLTGFAWSMLYLADTPRNCFPSLHVALAVLAGSTMWRSGYQAPAVIWPTLIVISTLTTKQHVTWDIAGGILLAVVVWTFTSRLFRYERTKPTNHAVGV